MQIWIFEAIFFRVRKSCAEFQSMHWRYSFAFPWIMLQCKQCQHKNLRLPFVVQLVSSWQTTAATTKQTSQECTKEKYTWRRVYVWQFDFIALNSLSRTWKCQMKTADFFITTPVSQSAHLDMRIRFGNLCELFKNACSCCRSGASKLVNCKRTTLFMASQWQSIQWRWAKNEKNAYRELETERNCWLCIAWIMNAKNVKHWFIANNNVF